MDLYFKIFEVLFPVFFIVGIGYLLGKQKSDIDSSFIELIPKNFVEISDEDFSTIEKLIDALDDLEDVQNVYSNYKVKSN